MQNPVEQRKCPLFTSEVFDPALYALSIAFHYNAMKRRTLVPSPAQMSSCTYGSDVFDLIWSFTLMFFKKKVWKPTR